MPVIKLTDNVGLDLGIETAGFSAFEKYARALPELISGHQNLGELLDFTLGDLPVKQLSFGLAFKDDVALGGAAELTIHAGARGTIAVTHGPGPMFAPEPFGDGIEIAAEECCLSFEIEASAGGSAAGTAGRAAFGASPQGALRLGNYRKFPAGVKFRQALIQAVGEFILPVSAADLGNLAADVVVAVRAEGSLTLSASADLLAVANPLASVKLPDPLPEIGVKAGGSVTVGAAVTWNGEYQVRARRTAGERVELGWYRNQGKTLEVRVAASEGIAAGVGGDDVLGGLLSAISANPEADEEELKKLPEQQADAIRQAVKAAAQRRIEIAVAAEVTLGKSGGAAFLFEVDPAAEGARKAIDAALAGNFDLFHAAGGTPVGVFPVRSIWTDATERGIAFPVNLLGVLNYISISKLLREGAALYDDANGTLILTDRVEAERIRATAVNFLANTEKLRKVLAGSVFLTLAYTGARHAIDRPSLRCAQSFYEAVANAGRDDLGDWFLIGAALNASTAGEPDLPEGVRKFGRATVVAGTTYDDALAASLFLDNGRPRSVAEFERAGRSALDLLVRPGAADAARRSIGDAQWAKMKSLGPANLAQLFPGVPAPIAAAIVADYVTIRWWADAMAGAAQSLAAMRQLFTGGPVDPADAKFVQLRKELSDHMADAVSKTREEFGQPWGLVATFLVSGGRAPVEFSIHCDSLRLPGPLGAKVLTGGAN